MHSTINPRRSSNKANLPILPNILANASDPTLVEKEAQTTDLKPKVLKHVRFVEPLPRYKASLLGENEKVEHPTQPTWNFDGIETQDPSKTVRGPTSKNRSPLEDLHPSKTVRGPSSRKGKSLADLHEFLSSSASPETNDVTTTEPKLNFDMLDSLEITDPSKTVRGPSSRKGRSLADLHEFLSSSASPETNDMTTTEPKLNFDMLDSLEITDPSKTVRGPSSRKGRSLEDLHKFLSSSATPETNDMTSNETSNETNNAASHPHVSRVKRAKRKCCAKVKKFFKFKIFSFK
ncbi:hypothetical protein ACO0QE_003970 [Hanseniaspora vineae]